ncbi:unnamed protein product [Closterium sp. NIES-54]
MAVEPREPLSPPTTSKTLAPSPPSQFPPRFVVLTPASPSHALTSPPSLAPLSPPVGSQVSTSLLFATTSSLTESSKVSVLPPFTLVLHLTVIFTTQPLVAYTCAFPFALALAFTRSAHPVPLSVILPLVLVLPPVLLPLSLPLRYPPPLLHPPPPSSPLLPPHPPPPLLPSPTPCSHFASQTRPSQLRCTSHHCHLSPPSQPPSHLTSPPLLSCSPMPIVHSWQAQAVLQSQPSHLCCRDRPGRTITLSQSHYIGQILEKFEMAQASPMPTSLLFGHQLAPPTSPSSSTRPYAELVGSVMYAMMCTRPDLAYPISVLVRFVGTGRHIEVHWKAAKRVLRYLRGTKDHALTHGGPSPPLLSSFSDSSWADTQPDRRFSQGYGFTLGSGLVSWRSTRSSFVSLSTCEAELYAGTMAAQESRWLCFLLAELGAPRPCPTLWCDNASTIHLTQDPVYHARSKLIELRYFFIRELDQRGLLVVRKIVVEANLVDIFTKALLRPAHSALLRLIGLARPGAP